MIDMGEFIEVMDNISADRNYQILKEIMRSSMVVEKEMVDFEFLAKAQDIINKGDASVYTDKPYLVTTRNQKYIRKILPEGAKSAFTILSAGDTLFELLSNGVQDIVAVDTNDLQTMIYKLRKASILTLSAKDFESFLISIHNNKFMSPGVFKTVKDGFDKSDEVAINFWEHLLYLNPKEDLINYFFKGLGGDVSKTLNALPYIKIKPSYYELRDKFEKAKITIRTENALEYFASNPNVKFDYIDITNILLFIYQLECNNDKEKFYKKIKQLKSIYDNNLNTNGVFALDYFFGIQISDLYTNNSNQLQYVKDIYAYTYLKLHKMFQLENLNISKLIDGFGEKDDTVILSRKKKLNE